MWPMDQLFQTVTGGEGDIRNEEIRTGIQLIRMLATSDRTKTPSRLGNKVSKPLMEKKRRARINKCLDQLKSLLESYYTNNIRKRKLEKADILELTVKHLRNLQKRQDCTREFSEYQAGFSSCLASVHQYLLGTDVNGSDRWMLSQLNKNLCGGKQAESYSTLDSDPSTVDTQVALTQRLSAPTSVGAELRKATSTARGDRCLRTLKPLMPRKRLCIGTKRSVVATHSLDNSACVFPSGQCRNHTVNTQVNVWRPW